LDKEFDAYISDLDPDTMTHEEKDSNKNAFIEVFFNGGPVAFPDGMDYVVCNEHTMLSWYLRRHLTTIADPWYFWKGICVSKYFKYFTWKIKIINFYYSNYVLRVIST
jgi:hypothetical protein